MMSALAFRGYKSGLINRLFFSFFFFLFFFPFALSPCSRSVEFTRGIVAHHPHGQSARPFHARSGLPSRHHHKTIVPDQYFIQTEHLNPLLASFTSNLTQRRHYWWITRFWHARTQHLIWIFWFSATVFCFCGRHTYRVTLIVMNNTQRLVHTLLSHVIDDLYCCYQ